jgi:hypothetical protein
MQKRYAFALFCAFTLLNVCFSPSRLLAEDMKLKAEDVVDKNLASIGTPEARATVQSRIVSGAVQMVYRLGGSGQLSGKINILSEGRKFRFGMNLGALDYPGDQFAFDGDKATVGQIRSRVRSAFSDFLYNNDNVIKEGLLGGTLSTAWPLLDLKGRQGKVEYTGLKTIDDKQLHEVQYKPKKGGGEMQVYFYFDPESFRHVRTRIRLVKPEQATGARIGESTGAEGTRYTLVEKFENFGVVDGLTLPQKYTLEFEVNSGENSTVGGSVVIDWDVALSQIVHNQQLDPKYFAVKFQ